MPNTLITNLATDVHASQTTCVDAFRVQNKATVADTDMDTDVDMGIDTGTVYALVRFRVSSSDKA
jgi:hypothetical protein